MTNKQFKFPKMRLAISIAMLLGMFSPNVAFALGGEWVAEAVVYSIFWFAVWVLASVSTFFVKTKPKTFARYSVWLIRLSLPMFIAWLIVDQRFIAPHLAVLKDREAHEIREVVGREFSELCARHVVQATKVLQISDAPRPKRLFLIQPYELYGPELSLNLANCATRKATTACAELGIQSIEWASRHSPGFGPCKNGIDRNNHQCHPEYRRYDLSEGAFSVNEIEKPLSEHVVRVVRTPKIPTSGIREIRKYLVSLESTQTGQVLGTTEVLMSWVEAPCPDPANAVANLIVQAFPNR